MGSEQTDSGAALVTSRPVAAKRPVPHGGPMCGGHFSTANIPGHADCPKVVAGRVGKKGKYQSQDCVFKSRDPQIKRVIWFLSSKQVTKARLSEQRRASRAPPHPERSGQQGGSGHLTCCDTGGRGWCIPGSLRRPWLAAGPG